MKIAIISDNRPSFRKPMGLSLSQMLVRIGVEPILFFDDDFDDLYLPDFPINFPLIRAKNTVKKALNFFAKEKYRTINLNPTKHFLKRLKECSAILVVAHMPASLSKRHHWYIESIRDQISIPIINYDLCFWSTKPPAHLAGLIDDPKRGFAGFNRFDWYIVVSNMGRFPQNEEVAWPVAVVGGDFTNKDLYPDQKNTFKVLVDFERSDHLSERALQLDVLNELKIPYTVLTGQYSHEEIYSIYREHSAYFLAHNESFGLPIVELQICGSYILTPYSIWATSHYINKAVSDPGEGGLSSNFVVYNNDRVTLKTELIRLRNEFYSSKESYSSKVIETFSREHAHLRFGDSGKLKEVIEHIRVGKLNGETHLKHKGLEKFILKR